jgi:hypothetical protein
VEAMSKPSERVPRKEITDEVAEQLTPVFSNYYPSTEQYKLYKKYEKRFDNENLRIKDFLTNHLNFCKNFQTGIESGIENSKIQGNPVAQTLFLDAITYLLETEIIGTAYIDRVLLLLIGKGVDFHLEPDYDHRYTRHAKSLEDLQTLSLSLSIKQDFLKANHITLFTKMIDRNLRNKIAHMDYRMENNCFYCKNKDGKWQKVDLSEKIQLLTEYYDALERFFFSQECKTKGVVKA